MRFRRTLSIFALVATALYWWFFKREFIYNEAVLKEEIVRESSFLECTLLSCYATNVLWDGEAFHVSAGISAFKFAGSIVHFGIGRPGAIGYLDTWTFMPQNMPGWLQAASKGIRKLKEEKRIFPTGKFVPVYVRSGEEYSKKDGDVLNGGLIVQVLWRNNFFRRLYLGAVAFVTQEYWKEKYKTESFDLLSMEDADCGHFEFGQVQHLSQNKKIIFKEVILGLYQKAMLEEKTFMMPDTPDFDFISSVYKKYAQKLQESIQIPDNFTKSSEILIIQRKSNRKIQIDKFSFIYLEDHSLEEQVRLMSSGEYVVVAHGAALTHMFYMKDSKPVFIELFPCGFRKSIYQNLALVLDVPYVYWQQTTNCFSLSCGALDWDNQASKNCWRNQDISISNHQIIQTIQEIGRVRNGEEKYLMYMPWEQFNNQIIAFKCACGVASLLNRTLVIPPLGYRKRTFLSRIVFDPLEYEWEPFEKYYDLGALPCVTIDYRIFYSLKRRIERVYFRRQGAKYTTRTQVELYYWFIAGIAYKEHRSLLYEMPVYLDSEWVKEYLGRRYEKMPVLALGNVFWLYTFDQNLHYPLHKYVDMIPNDDYRQIVKALNPNSKIKQFAKIIGARLGKTFGCVHWRLGDYESKCREELYAHRCWIVKDQLLTQLQQRGNMTWYVATNESSKLNDLFPLGLVTLSNIIESKMDVIEQVLVDQLVCMNANQFIGNMYSSQTRSIIDYRILNSKPYELF